MLMKALASPIFGWLAGLRRDNTMNINRLPTLEDVARRAGVSTATVSRCLNAPERVRPQTRDRVEAAVAELGYTPHFGGRMLASKRTDTVGVIIPTMESAIFALGLQALQDELATHGVTLLVATSHYDMEREAQQIRVMLGRGVDGIVLIGEARSQETYAFLEKRGIPFVLVWSYSGGSPYPCVGFDNRAAACQLTDHVLGLGHTRIAMIAGLTAHNDRAGERVHGVREALSNRGLQLEAPYYVETPYALEPSAEAAQRLLRLSPPPTAIVCGNDVLAVGAILGARKAGKAVPRDVSVVGFDDIELAVVIDPPLTTVRVPHRRMGRAAASKLLSMIDSSDAGESIQFETQIVERGSLAAPANAG
jgi:LacI family transcriptional regulator